MELLFPLQHKGGRFDPFRVSAHAKDLLSSTMILCSPSPASSELLTSSDATEPTEAETAPTTDLGVDVLIVLRHVQR